MDVTRRNGEGKREEEEGVERRNVRLGMCRVE